MIRDKWDPRIQRATELAGRFPFAAEGLRFYERIASFQKSLYNGLATGNGAAKIERPPGGLRAELELFALLPWFASFLSFIQDIAPAPLAQSAASLSTAGSIRWEEVLDEFWRAGAPGGAMSTISAAGISSPSTPAEELIAWAFLQPYAEHLADHTLRPELHDTPLVCPVCSARPQVGVLRPLGDGGKRSLICSLCATEWDFRRIVCPACGEEDVGKLPVYVAEEHPHVRVEACDTCHYYIKTIDLTKDGRAVPVVDELAAIPLSLWAVEHEYTKVSTNLLGI
ncbi:MAG TPA: formate dehydrogenase accessory protein FdhE [Thermoanaerobaculia bacterium]|jgi:FdhE protein|nr:formate dehydrogenase accessory protein FdhE [Thermoanaerobaculia bacterium]